MGIYRFQPSPLGTCHNLSLNIGGKSIHIANIFQHTRNYFTGKDGDNLWYIDGRGFNAPQGYATIQEAKEAAMVAWRNRP